MQSKIIQTMLTAVFLSIAGWLAPVAHAADVIEAKDFRLIGPNGELTAQLTTSREGTPALFFYDSSGRLKLNLGIYPEGPPGIILFDGNGQAAALLRLAEEDGSPVLVFKEDGQDKMIIGLHEKSILSPDGSTAPLSSTFLQIIIAAVVGLVAGLMGGRLSRPNRV